MRSIFRALLLASCLLAVMAPARADTAMTLFKSFSGNINFAGTQVTIRDKASGASPCRVSAESVVQSANLSLPSLATVVSAHLYWAGSGSTTDTAVAMNGKPVTAASNRVYTSGTIGNGLNYFSAAADVTEQVKLKGSGTYTFSGLRVSNGSPWCDHSAVLGGYALVVVYSHFNETYRALNLYEGFRAMLNSEVRLDMSNFRVPDNVTPSTVGRFGHLVWEGDQALAQQGESLWFNGVSLVNSTYGPSGNNFNSKSSVNSDGLSLGIDFDAYGLTGWPAKLNTVSALFRTGGDLVLLNAAVLAVPSTPAADLAVDLVRTGDLRPNSAVTYTATVTNGGPGFEPGPVKLTLTLPTGLSYASFSGANWSCTGSGSVVNCTYTGSLTVGARTVLTLQATVASGASGSKTTTVTVTGNNDPGSTNNQDSDTGMVVTASGLTYEYTQRACKVGETVGAGAACPSFAGPVVAGSTPTIFLTAVDSANRATTPSTSQSTSVSLSLALGCVNPSTTAGAIATYGGIKLPLCERDSAVPASTTAWQNVTANFSANTVSLSIPFRYPDAGLVKLYVRSGSTVDFVQFVSIPDKLKLTVTNAQGQAPNPGNYALGANGFVRAAEPFTVSVTALGVDEGNGVRADLKNFGKEEGKLARPVLDNTVSRLDTPAGNAPKITTAGLEGVNGGYAASGAFGGQFFWSDVGSFTLGVNLTNYLGVALDSVLGRARGAFDDIKVGRVYPAWFSTAAGRLQADGTMGKVFDCLPRMRCPYVGLAAVNGAVYSNQPFDVTIVAHDVNGRELENFDSARFPSLVPTITLAAVDAPGTGTPYTKIATGFADTPGAATTRSVKFGLGPAFDASAAKKAWMGPTPVYLRATAPDSRMGAALTISSVQSDVAESEEGGIMVVNGRLAITNVIGSELLRTPIPMTAQYWTGTNWEANTAFSHPTLLATSQASFSSCQRTLGIKNMAGTNNCNTQLVKTATPGTLALTGGGTKYVLAPVGAGQFGSFRIQMKTEEWLPSMFGQVTIGAYKSPVIYIREMY
jgi:hypothetical protein